MSDTPRVPCPSCCRKHMGQAIVLLQESLQGYPDHRWLAMGHMAEAEAEAMAVYPDIAETLRQARKKMEMEPEWMPVLLPVISEISKRVQKTNAKQSCDGSCSTGGDMSREDRIAKKLVAGLKDKRVIEKKGKVLLVEETFSDGSLGFSVDIARSRVSFVCTSLTDAEKVFAVLTNNRFILDIEV